MTKRIWTIEEERIVCRAYLDTLDYGVYLAGAINLVFEQEGIEKREIRSIVSKINDYRRIHNKGDLSHVARKSIKIYKELTRHLSTKFKDVNNFVKENYGIKSPIIDYDFEYDLVCSNNRTTSTSNYLLNSHNNYNNLIVKGLDANVEEISFVDYFMKLCIDSGMDDSEIYNSIGMQRQKFHKIKNGQAITKRSLIMLAIALKLDYNTTVKFLALGNTALVPGCLMDTIITYVIEHSIYDPFDIDELLDYYNLETLFSDL